MIRLEGVVGFRGGVGAGWFWDLEGGGLVCFGRWSGWVGLGWTTVDPARTADATSVTLAWQLAGCSIAAVVVSMGLMALLTDRGTGNPPPPFHGIPLIVNPPLVALSVCPQG